MNAKAVYKGNFKAMLKQREDSVESTRRKLHDALDRFERREMKAFPHGAKLTVRNLATEAGVSKDTPLSRHLKNHLAAGNHRFPDVVERFNALKEKLNSLPKGERKEVKVKRLCRRIKELEKSLLLSARANNLLDTEIVEVKKRNKEMEEDNARLREENARLRQGSLRVIPTSK